MNPGRSENSGLTLEPKWQRIMMSMMLMLMNPDEHNYINNPRPLTNTLLIHIIIIIIIIIIVIVIVIVVIIIIISSHFGSNRPRWWRLAPPVSQPASQTAVSARHSNLSSIARAMTCTTRTCHCLGALAGCTVCRGYDVPCNENPAHCERSMRRPLCHWCLPSQLRGPRSCCGNVAVGPQPVLQPLPQPQQQPVPQPQPQPVPQPQPQPQPVPNYGALAVAVPQPQQHLDPQPQSVQPYASAQ